MKLKIKLTIIIGLLMTMMIAVLSVALLSSARKLQIEMTMKEMKSSTGLYANELEGHYDDYISIAETAAQLMGSYQNIEADRRRFIFTEDLRALFERNPRIMGIYAAWKPGVLDGMDELYRNARGSDANGNFVPWFNREQGVEEFGAMPDYQPLLNALSANLEISDPVEHIVDGELSFIVHFRAAIMDPQNNPVGLVGVAADTRYSGDLIGNITPYDVGRAELYTTDGTIVASHQEELIGRYFQEAKIDRLGLEGIRQVEQAMRNGEPVFIENSGILFQAYPFRIGGADDSWILLTSVPMQAVLKEVNDMTRFSIILAGAAILLAATAGMVVARQIAKPISGISKTLKDISEGEGDLTQKIAVTSKSEIGDLGRYFNLTLEKIKQLIIIIKQQSTALSEVGNELSSNMAETAAAVNEITANIQSIKSRVISQSASVTETNSTMEQITVNIDKLNSHVARQSSSVDSSSSAIEQMIANIQSVTQTLIKNVDNVRDLANSSETGRISLQEVAADIKEISRESEGLMEINGVMENIASQTNLLSMNAAIEAAHAGEAGKGFAVVADEIRKLAESSSDQSKTISEVLKKIKGSIDKITDSTSNALGKFETIDGGVKTVAEQEEHIRNAMEEQSAGSKQIMEAISHLNEITHQVREGSTEMLEGSKEVIQESKNLEMVTQEISGGMNEMAVGADQINSAVNEVNSISGRNKENIDILVKEVSRFKVE
jgi:methyl-accepting chemotaxis protein